MNYISLLLFVGALAAGNFFYHWITDQDWVSAFDCSFSQFAALNLYWVLKANHDNTPIWAYPQIPN